MQLRASPHCGRVYREKVRAKKNELIENILLENDGNSLRSDYHGSHYDIVYSSLITFSFSMLSPNIGKGIL
jgi:hypothetical protein